MIFLNEQSDCVSDNLVRMLAFWVNVFYLRCDSGSDILVKSRALYWSRRPAARFFFVCCVDRLIWTVSAPEPTMMVYLLLLTLDRYGLNALGPTLVYICER